MKPCHAAGQCWSALAARSDENERRQQREKDEGACDNAEFHPSKAAGTTAAPVISHWQLYLSFYYYDLLTSSLGLPVADLNCQNPSAKIHDFPVFFRCCSKRGD